MPATADSPPPVTTEALLILLEEDDPEAMAWLAQRSRQLRTTPLDLRGRLHLQTDPADFLFLLEEEYPWAVDWLEQRAEALGVSEAELWAALLRQHQRQAHAEPPRPRRPYYVVSTEARIESLAGRYGPQNQEEGPGRWGLYHPQDLSTEDRDMTEIGRTALKREINDDGEIDKEALPDLLPKLRGAKP